MKKVRNKYKKVIIIGDFNYKNLKWYDDDGEDSNKVSKKFKKTHS